ncbi:hypothetical protein [Selenomonas sp. ND2010]|uniref:hypothetical protein n=1 Tax=Selenomonas sp. ND2010 TaxID=1410618 RepID=UPI00051B7EC4|nr:hypothetical protein [Selenomonas sp. ND2010]
MENTDSSKKIAKNTILLYTRQVVVLFLNLYIVRQVLYVLGETDYGVYTVVAGIVTMFSIFSGALSGACQRFFSYDLGKKEYASLSCNFSAVIIIHLIACVIIFLLTESVGLWYVLNELSIPDGRYNAAILVYQSSIIVLVMTIAITPYIAIVLANEDMHIFAIISVIEAGFKFLSITIVSFCPGDRLIMYSASFVIVELFVVAAYYYTRKKKYKRIKFVRNYNGNNFREILSFVGWNMFGASIYPLKNQGINVIYNQIFGTGIIPGRGVAASVNSAVTSFYTNFSNAIKPQIVKRYAADGIDGVKNIVYASSKVTYFLMFAIMFPFIAEMDTILWLWLGYVPQYAIVFSQLSLVETLIYSISDSLSSLIDATGKIKKYQLAVGGVQLCNLPLTTILVHYVDNPILAYVIAIFLAIISTLVGVTIVSELTGLQTKEFIFRVIIRLVSASIIPIVLIIIIKYLWIIKGWMIIPTYLVLEVILVIVFYVVCFNRREKDFLRGFLRFNRG